MKLAPQEKKALNIMRDGNKAIIISRFSCNVLIAGTDTEFPANVLEGLIDKDLASYSHMTDIHNCYRLT